MNPGGANSLLLAPQPVVASLGAWDTTSQFGMTYSNGNRTISENATGSYAGAFSVTKHSTGKWYFEITINYSNGNDIFWGVAITTSNMSTSYLNVGQYLMRSAGDYYGDGSSTHFSIAHASNTRYGVAVDLDNKKIWFMDPFNVPNYINSGNPATGTTPTGAMTAGGSYGICARSDSAVQSNNVWNAFFDVSQLLYTPPSGFSAWG